MFFLVAAQAIIPAHRKHITIPNVSQRFSISVDLDTDPSGSEDTVTAPATVKISWRKTGKPIQTIRMPALTIFKGMFALDVPAKGSSPSPYGDTYSFVFQDFNFDGQQDLAICKDNNGSYGAPTYDVFLWRPAQKQFIRDAILSKLSSEHLGLIVRDPARRELTTFDKDGAAWHTWSTYRWRNKRLVLVKEEVDDARGDKEVITTKTLIGSHWKTIVKRRPIKENG